MKRKHSMPFGAECLPDGRVRFRLWAPEVAHIDLALENSTLAMCRSDCGWFELLTDQASAGSRYQFLVNEETHVPDPVSRYQPQNVHGPSQVIDPTAFQWTDANWPGRPWEETVIYELHVGAFSPCGTFAGVEEKLDYLVGLGITALELMPVSDFFGRRNWGYDGVLPYAPDSSYGRPEDLKRLIQVAHGKGVMVFLDVVYNHFGPEGNYLRLYAPQFFTARHRTPWGDGINFENRTVRDFYIHNALYWLEEFHFDGLRLDAVHAIQDDSSPHILTELAETVRKNLGVNRRIHLILENDDNAARYLPQDCAAPSRYYDAQWNDDIHHACHVLVSGESDGYYADYAEHPINILGKCLIEGFYFQGQPSTFRAGRRRGESSQDLPLTSFISFLQNHDQVGNRAYGERILSLANSQAVRTVMAILLLAPSPPLLFMGEEFGAQTPFLFFCDFEAELAKAVTDGRREEFAKFAQFRDPATRNTIPDPNAQSTFIDSKLNWSSLQEPEHEQWLDFYSQLLALRQKEIVSFVCRSKGSGLDAAYSVLKGCGLSVQWEAEKRTLDLVANFGNEPIAVTHPAEARLIYSTVHHAVAGSVPPSSVAWYVNS
jgi:maltooligosyltrehalose trehalohydrolase